MTTFNLGKRPEMKKLILCSLLINLPAMATEFYANHTYSNYKEVEDANSTKMGMKFDANEYFDTVTADIEYKSWDLNDEKVDDNGFSGNVVGYYNFGKDNQWHGISQLQAANADLFPKFTAYQELNYRAGEKKNVLLGVGMGYQDYHHQDADTFFKVGPVYYFDKGAVGYKYGKYTDSNSTLHSLFANYKLTDKLDTDFVYNFGEGHWDYEAQQLANIITMKEASVDSREATLKLSYQATDKLSVNTSVGRILVKDNDTDKTSLSATTVGIGTNYKW